MVTMEVVGAEVVAIPTLGELKNMIKEIIALLQSNDQKAEAAIERTIWRLTMLAEYRDMIEDHYEGNPRMVNAFQSFSEAVIELVRVAGAWTKLSELPHGWVDNILVRTFAMPMRRIISARSFDEAFKNADKAVGEQQLRMTTVLALANVGDTQITHALLHAQTAEPQRPPWTEPQPDMVVNEGWNVGAYLKVQRPDGSFRGPLQPGGAWGWRRGRPRWDRFV